MNITLLVEPFMSLPSAVSPELSSVSPVTSSLASWQGYLAPIGAPGLGGKTAMTGLAMTDSHCGGHVAQDALHAVAGVAAIAAAPFAMPLAASTLAATATAVAGNQQVATAPKQAEKPNDTRNDVFPLGTRPGAPPS